MIKKEEATVTSVSIEVKVIRIGKRQMTLAVFDQLPNGTKEVMENGIFGDVWGKVHRKDEWHIITEYEGQLWRINLSGIIQGMKHQNSWAKDRMKLGGSADDLKALTSDILTRNAKMEQLQEVIDSQPQLFIAV